jgi:hypothetical protein
MKVILSVPDEGYSERTWWRLFWAYLWWRLFWEYLMKVILSVPDEGYSECSSTNKTDRHDKAEILLKVALNSITITLTLKYDTW